MCNDGAIDWLPIASLDGTPAFAALVDAASGGSIALAPVAPFTVTRRYLPGTNVLETTFTTEDGVATLTDALVTGVAGRLPWIELARRVDGVSGSIRFRWLVAPGTCLGTAQPWVQKTTHGKVIRVDGVTLAVTGVDHGPRGGGDRAIAGGFTTTAKSRHLLSVVGAADEPLHLPNPQNVDRSIDRTIANWQAWSAEFSYDGPWADAVQRSALALKLLIQSPFGSIAAAATTSLPETLAGGKNWDYRYAWVRDVAYTLSALTRFGLREETHAAVSWLLTTIKKHGPELHVFYTLDGELPPKEVHKREAPGWRGAGPVAEGNPAGEQLQLGVYGDLFTMMREYVDAGNVLDVETGRLLASIADRTCDEWQKRDSGMWELEQLEHYTSSKMGCWAALSAAVHLCEIEQIPGSPDRWRAEMTAIEEWIAANGWSEHRQAYVMYPGTERLDASVLLHAPSGFDRGPRMSSTIDALRAELGRGDLLFRYSGAEKEEATFTSCAFWLAGALMCVGRQDEAVELMDQLVSRGNDVGLFSEMIDPADGAFLGNIPQGLSHLALITTAITIEQLRR